MSLLTLLAQLLGLVVGLVIVAALWSLLTLSAQLLGLVAGLVIVAVLWLREGAR